jgi:hypothetical protein
MKTAVELLFEKLWNTDKDELTWYAMLEAAKEMEKKEREKIFKQAQECAVKQCGVYFKYESFEQLENNTN